MKDNYDCRINANFHASYFVSSFEYLISFLQTYVCISYIRKWLVSIQSDMPSSKWKIYNAFSMLPLWPEQDVFQQHLYIYRLKRGRLRMRSGARARNIRFFRVFCLYSSSLPRFWLSSFSASWHTVDLQMVLYIYQSTFKEQHFRVGEKLFYI